MIEIRTRALAGLVALAGVLAPMTAAGEPLAEGTVAVPPLTIEGELPKQSVQRLEERLLEGLRDAGFEIATARACTDDACIEAIATDVGASTVLRAAVRVQQRDYAMSAELVAADGARVLVSANDECDLCGVEEAADRLAGLAVSIRRGLEADARARPVLTVTTTPPGAAVVVDGRRVGVSPLELTLPPGRHEVRLAKPGYGPRAREVELVKGVDASIAVDLFPVATVETTAKAPRVAPKWIGWTVLGGGAAATVVGVALLSLHGQPIRSKCTGGNVDMDGTCRFVHATLVPGAILGAAGLGLLSTGIALVVTRKKRAGRSGTARLDPTLGGASIRF